MFNLGLSALSSYIAVKICIHDKYLLWQAEMECGWLNNARNCESWPFYNQHWTQLAQPEIYTAKMHF